MTEPAAHIGDREVGAGHPVYVIAEVSANHNGSLDRAKQIVDAAADAGVDAVKLQTYTADSLTIRSDAPPFRVGGGTAWDGRLLHDLYEEASTPWEWMQPLFEHGRLRGLDVFSTPFDRAAIELLEALDPAAHKVASFELGDLELVRLVAETGRTVIASTGMATQEEIERALAVMHEAGAGSVVLLRCNSSYPAPTTEMDLRTIPDMLKRFGVPVGLSDHTMSTTATLVAVALGACVVEKHLTLDRCDGGPDSGFSLEPTELADLVAAVREAEAALGGVRYGPSPAEQASTAFKRSLFAVETIELGGLLTRDNVRSIRPGYGLPPALLPDVIGRRATTRIERGTPLSWDLIGPGDA